MNNLRLGQRKCPDCGKIMSTSIHEKCFCDWDEKDLLNKIFDKTKPKTYEDEYDSIMKKAREILDWQDKIGNPYAMHVAVENAIKELDELQNKGDLSNPITDKIDKESR